MRKRVTIFLWWLAATMSMAQTMELRRVHDSLFLLNGWRLPYPVYQFQTGDVDGDGRLEAMVGVIIRSPLPVKS